MISSAIIVSAIVVLSMSVATGSAVRQTVPVVALAVAAALVHNRIVAWPALLTTLIVVFLFVPIRRYSIAGNLPFQLEPYRLLVAFVGAGWLASLLVDSRVRLRKSGLEGPLLLIIVVILASDVVNTGRVGDLSLQADVAKRLTFFASFIVVFYVIVSLIRSQREIEILIRALVASAAALSILGVLERITGYNVFNHLAGTVPLLGRASIPYTLVHPRGRLRVYASAENPIALGAVFVMLLPLAVYLARTTRQRRWWIAAALVTLGTLATVSRTAVVMLVVAAVVMLRLCTTNVKRLWPAIIPVLLAAHFALPGTLGSLKDSFFPRGGLISEQEAGKGTYGSGRLADLGPSLHEFSRRPVLGEGFGTRITDKGPHQNASILDDQWLATLLETGLTGAFAWVWLLARFFRRMSCEARIDNTSRGLLCGALAASVAALAVGMLGFDAFSFAQATLVLFMLLAFGSSLTSDRHAWESRRVRRVASAESQGAMATAPLSGRHRAGSARWASCHKVREG